MRRVIATMLVPVFLGLVTAAAQLPPEIMADRYLVRVERLMVEKNHEAALQMMDKIIALQKEHNLTVPDEFHFKYAQIAFSAGSTKAAIDSLNKYLAAAGREGRFYRVALELLDEAEQKQAEQEKIQATVDKYLAEAERLIAEKKDKAAVDLVDQLLNLRRAHNLTLPQKFHFLYARAALSVGSFKLAQDSANRYLSEAGASGKYYGETQELLEEARAKIREEARAEARAKWLSPNEMVTIPGGRFQMGCVSGKSCERNEKPVHGVRMASFEMSKYEVTFEEYDRFTAETGRERVDDEGWGRGRRPVINASWSDAVAYTEWLSAKLGEPYRLPTEAEWEYAARAGSGTQYHFGNNREQLCRYANHADRTTDYDGRNKACSDGVGKMTATVATYQPNAFGLYDMHGNVGEWVGDCLNKRYKSAPSDGSAWESGDCSLRVFRGGTWASLARQCRPAYRACRSPGARYGFLGFRLLREE